MAASGIPSSIVVFDTAGVGPSGSMCSRASACTGTRPKVSISGSQLPQRGEDLDAALVARPAPRRR